MLHSAPSRPLDFLRCRSEQQEPTAAAQLLRARHAGYISRGSIITQHATKYLFFIYIIDTIPRSVQKKAPTDRSRGFQLDKSNYSKPRMRVCVCWCRWFLLIALLSHQRSPDWESKLLPMSVNSEATWCCCLHSSLLNSVKFWSKSHHCQSNTDLFS